MIKIFRKIQFSHNENRMKSIADTKIARELYENDGVKIIIGPTTFVEFAQVKKYNDLVF